MRHIVLVDLDNLYIINNKVSVTKLKNRLSAIAHLRLPTKYFGNRFTKHLLMHNKIPLRMYTTEVQKDSADHALIHFLKGFEDKYDVLHIVSNDMVLAKLAYFLSDHPDKLRFHKVSSNDLVSAYNIHNYCFKHKLELQKFLDSYNLYKARFML